MKQTKLTQKQISELNTVIKQHDSTGPEVRRALAILLLDQEVAMDAIKATTKYSRRHVFTLRTQYFKQGIDALTDKRKGKPKELLTRKQQSEIVDIMKTKSPREFHYNSDFWTTSILGDYILRQYDVQYKSKTSYYLIFRKAQFTYHVPGRTYKERDEAAVQKWRKETKPKLKSLWHEKDTVILCADEMILTTHTTTQKVWLPEGQYPKIEVSNSHRERRNIYGFLNLRTGRQHAFKTMKQNMRVTRDVLKHVRKLYPRKKIALFWDSAGWHKGSEVTQFIDVDQKIKIIHFPTYAPEQNPQEHVWKKGRSHVSHNRFIEDIDTATDEFISYLNKTVFPYALLGFSAIS